MDSLPLLRRRFVASNAFDAAGRSFFEFSIDIVAVAVIGATTAQIGFLNAAGMLAFLGLSASMGVLADRVNPRVSIVICSLIKCALAGLVAIFLVSATLTFPLLLSVAVLFGIASLVTETSQTALIPRVAASSGVPALAGSLQAWDNGLGAVIPAGAAIAFTYLHGGWVMMFAAVLLLFSGLLLVRFHREPRVSKPRNIGGGSLGKTGFLQELAAGFGPFRAILALRRIVFSTMMLNAALAVVSAIEMVFLLRVIGLPVAIVGISSAFGAVGGTLGASISGRLVARLGLFRVVAMSSIVLVVGASMLLLLLVSVPVPLLATILCVQSFLWGTAQVAKNVAVYSWFTTIVPVEILGRASGLQRTATMGIIPLASVVGGLLGGWSVVGTLLIGVGLTIISGLSVWSLKAKDRL